MTRWEKLIARVLRLSGDLRFEEIEKLLISYSYSMDKATGGSHCVFRKKGSLPICIPKKSPVKLTYVEMLRKLIEEGCENEDNR